MSFNKTTIFVNEVKEFEVKFVCSKCLNPFDQISSRNRCICLDSQKQLDFAIKVSCFSEEKLIVRAYRNSAYKILKLNEDHINVK